MRTKLLALVFLLAAPAWCQTTTSVPTIPAAPSGLSFPDLGVGGQLYNVKAYGAVGGASHTETSIANPVSGWCTNHGGTRFTAANDTVCLSAVQAAYPEVTAVTNSMDFAAINGAIDASKVNGSYGGTILLPSSTGCYEVQAPINNGNGVILRGEGSPGSCIVNTGSGYAIHINGTSNSYTLEDFDIYATASAGGGVSIGGSPFRHILLKQMNITLPSGGTAYGEETNDGSSAGIDITNITVRAQGGAIGFHVQSSSSSNQWMCIDCYADGQNVIGFAFGGGFDQMVCEECAADSATTAGYDINPSGGFVHLINPTGELDGITYRMEGTTAGSSVLLDNPTAFEAVNEAYLFHTGSGGSGGIDAVLIHPSSISTTGTNSAVCNSTPASLTIIGNTAFDKSVASNWTTCQGVTITNQLAVPLGSYTTPAITVNGTLTSGLYFIPSGAEPVGAVCFVDYVAGAQVSGCNDDEGYRLGATGAVRFSSGAIQGSFTFNNGGVTTNNTNDGTLAICNGSCSDNDHNGNVILTDMTTGLGGMYECSHGSNATCGVATLSSGTVTVSTTAIAALAASGAAGDVVNLVLQSCSSCGTLSVGTVTAATSFVINSTNGSDASKVYWEIRKVN